MKLQYQWGDETITLDATRSGDVVTVKVGDQTLTVQGSALQDGALALKIDGRPATVITATDGDDRHLAMGAHRLRTTRLQGRGGRRRRSGGAGGGLTSPMPGQVLRVMAEAGQAVKAGQTLMLLEAMKMEHAIKAPRDGVIKRICFNAGDMVTQGAELIELESESSD